MSFDRVYYNVTVRGGVSGGQYVPARVSVTLPQAIIEHAQDYLLEVVRFTLTAWNIPLFAPVTNRVYKLGINHSGTISMQTVALTETYSMQDFVAQLNAGLALAATAAGVSNAWFQYDVANTGIGTLSFVCPVAWSATNLVCANTELKDLLPGFNWKGSAGAAANDAQWSFDCQTSPSGYNAYNPPSVTPVYPPGFLRFVQDTPAAAALCPIRKIQLVSHMLPCINEYSGGGEGIVSTPVVKDYVPILNNGLEARSSIDYVPEGESQLIVLMGDVPIRAIDLSARWAGEDGVTRDVTLPYGGIFDAKLAFRVRGSA